MPWTPSQHRLFEFVSHDPSKAKKEGIDIKPGDAARMAAEGIRKKGEEMKKGGPGA